MQLKKTINEDQLDLKEIFNYIIKRNKELEGFDGTYYISRTLLYRGLPKELGGGSFVNATIIFDRLAKEGYIKNPDSDLGRYKLRNIEKFLENIK